MSDRCKGSAKRRAKARQYLRFPSWPRRRPPLPQPELRPGLSSRGPTRYGWGLPVRIRRRAEDGVMTARTSFRGSLTALVTPFRNGSLDEKAFRELVDWQITEGTRGLVPVGTTGESPTLSHAEHRQVVEWCVDQANRRVPVIAGAGSNSTAEAIEFARHAEKAGADAVLIVTPYYNKPTQEGLDRHFKSLHDAIGIPI